jgi:NAD(P)H-flavin reductase
VNAVASGAWTPTPLPIRGVTRETRDTFTFALDAPGDGFSFAPGQFNMLYVFGVGEVPISVNGDTARPKWLLHTVRAVGAVTRAMCALRRGKSIGVRGPFGHGWPLDEARGRDVLVVAGGLGLAPLRPAIYYLLRHRERYGRVAILYGARSPDELLYRRELERWSARREVEARVIVDRAGPGWAGPVGVVPSLLARVEVSAGSTVAMVCGPEVMMRFTVRDLERLGVARERIFVSLERDMKCGLGLCGHCQLGPHFVCKDGPVLRYDRVAELIHVREV